MYIKKKKEENLKLFSGWVSKTLDGKEKEEERESKRKGKGNKEEEKKKRRKRRRGGKEENERKRRRINKNKICEIIFQQLLMLPIFHEDKFLI